MIWPLNKKSSIVNLALVSNFYYKKNVNLKQIFKISLQCNVLILEFWLSHVVYELELKNISIKIFQTLLFDSCIVIRFKFNPTSRPYQGKNIITINKLVSRKATLNTNIKGNNQDNISTPGLRNVIETMYQTEVPSIDVIKIYICRMSQNKWYIFLHTSTKLK